MLTDDLQIRTLQHDCMLTCAILIRVSKQVCMAEHKQWTNEDPFVASYKVDSNQKLSRIHSKNIKRYSCKQTKNMEETLTYSKLQMS